MIHELLFQSKLRLKSRTDDVQRCATWSSLCRKLPYNNNFVQQVGLNSTETRVYFSHNVCCILLHNHAMACCHVQYEYIVHIRCSRFFNCPTFVKLMQRGVILVNFQSETFRNKLEVVLVQSSIFLC